MLDGEWSLSYPGTSLLFGTPATPVWNRKTPDVGDVDITDADVKTPRGDGRRFGTDFRGARTITFDLGVRSATEADARIEAASLTTAWRADAVRSVPGAVAELRARYAGRERLVYGRPRRFAPDYSDAAVNHIVTALATFDVIDDVFYDADEQVQTVAFAPPAGGGLMAPLAAPLGTTRTSDRSVGLTVDSELPVWPVVEIKGPITNPVVEITSNAEAGGDPAADGSRFSGVRLELRTSLAYDQTVVIDTRPWMRSVLRDGASISGALRGARLAEASIPAGSYELALRGLDATGTATARVRWRGSHSTL